MRVGRVCLVVGFVALAVAVSKRSASAATQTDDASARTFWTAFRTAVQKKDKAALLGLANFPFVVRWGNADPNDPMVKLNHKELSEAMDRVLVIKTAEADPHGQPMTAVVEGVTTIPASDAKSGEFVLESFEFRKVRAAWRWTAAFTTDPSFYPTADSYEVTRDSPLRKMVIDAVSKAMTLRRPLTVRHLRTNGRVAYIEAQEPGRDGRRARAFLQKQADAATGRSSVLVKESSFVPAEGGDDEWREKMAAERKLGAPASLFPTETVRQERDAHGQQKDTAGTHR